MMDETPYKHTYYRIKLVDRDGRYTYSSIVDLTRLSRAYGLVNVYPNPTSGDVNISLNTAKEGTLSLSIVDISGRLISHQNVSITQGEQVHTLEMNDLSEGIYFVKMVGEDMNEIIRMVKQ